MLRLERRITIEARVVVVVVVVAVAAGRGWRLFSNSQAINTAECRLDSAVCAGECGCRCDKLGLIFGIVWYLGQTVRGQRKN